MQNDHFQKKTRFVPTPLRLFQNAMSSDYKFLHFDIIVQGHFSFLRDERTLTEI